MRPPLIWISSRGIALCVEEARRLYPLETGGVLIGYWADPETAVVRSVTGPGPRALHARYSFEDDHAWQAAEITKQYESSGRRLVYLGDWHSHPDAAHGGLSRTDRSALRSIIAAPQARMPTPLMVILYGNPQEWRHAAWLGQLRSRRLFWPKLTVQEGKVNVW